MRDILIEPGRTRTWNDAGHLTFDSDEQMLFLSDRFEVVINVPGRTRYYNDGIPKQNIINDIEIGDVNSAAEFVQGAYKAAGFLDPRPADMWTMIGGSIVLFSSLNLSGVGGNVYHLISPYVSAGKLWVRENYIAPASGGPYAWSFSSGPYTVTLRLSVGGFN
jgi:hypothetical protein